MKQGRIPRELAGDATELSVQLVDKKTEMYEPPKEKFKAFQSTGRSLNSKVE